MLFYVTLSLVAVVLSAANDSDETCPLYGTMACADLLAGKDILRFDNKPLEENEANLEKQCKDTLPYVKCVVDFGSRCPNYMDNIYYQTFKDQYSTCRLICDKDNGFRRSFLESARCLNKQNERRGDKCGNIPRFPGSFKDFTQEFCLTVKDYIKCSIEDIEEKCGSEALMVAK
ncbi:hypothetical protein X975_09219, partial [Stegodyphus mimosarum]